MASQTSTAIESFTDLNDTVLLLKGERADPGNELLEYPLRGRGIIRLA